MNKQRLFTHTTSTYWILQLGRSVPTARCGLNLYRYLSLIFVCKYCGTGYIVA